MSRAERPLVVPCPHCGCARGVRCTTPRGVPTNQPHTARIERYTAGWPGPAQAPKGRPTPKRPEVESAHARLARRALRRERHRKHEDRRRARALKRGRS